MNFKEIFSFELKYQLSRPATWIYLAVVLSLAGLATWSLIANVRNGDYFLNSPVILSLITAIASMFALLLSAVISGNATVRDKEAIIEPLFFTTSLRKGDYLGARFLAVWIIHLLLLVTILLLLFAVSHLPTLNTVFTSNSFPAYLRAFVLFAVPNSLVITGIVFSLGVISRRAMAGFLGAGILFFVALIMMDIVAGELGKWELGKTLDPSGLTVLREFRLIKSPAEMQVDQVVLDESLLWNRLLWIGIALIFMIVAYLKFNFSHKGAGRKSKKRKVQAPVGIERIRWAPPVTVSDFNTAFSFKDELRQMGYLSLRSFTDLIKGKVWLLLLITGGILILVSEEVLEGQLGVPMISTGWKVLQLLQFLPVVILLAILITFFAGELIWRERDSRMNEISDASPVSTRVLYFSKFTALFLIILFMQLILLCTGIVIQAMNGNSVDLWLFLRVLLGFQLLELLLFAVVAFTVHVLVNQKYISHLVAVVAFYYMNFHEQLGLQHHLLIFGSSPGYSYSEMSGFEPTLGPWLWFKGYWAAWAILLALASRLFWFRGKEAGFSRRLSTAKKDFRRKHVKVGIPALMGIFILGGFIFYNTNIQNTYLSAHQRLERRALYEQLYGRYKDVSQPVLSAVNLQAEIYPEDQRAEISGTYELVNNSSVAIDTLHISTSSDFEVSDLRFSIHATALLLDEDLGHRMYKLAVPLQPEDTLKMNFLTTYEKQGFSNYGRDKKVVSNGTYFGFENMPSVGYLEHREISDKEDREKFNLPARPAVPSYHDEKVRTDMSRAGKIRFEAILGTAKDQTAITAGTLRRSWTENDRSYFHYVTDVPITHNYEILSAVYEMYESYWNDVQIQIYYHPGHSRNVQRMIEGVRTSLDYFSKTFSPYPHNQIRLAEYPASGVGLNGNPVNMTFSEGFAFYAPEKDVRGLDFPFAIVAHEVAHQWWGNELRPAYAEGAAVLTESLAWYSSTVLVENTFGKEHLENLLRVMRHEYLTPRSSAGVPLLKTTDRFSAVRRGPFALYATKEYVGEDKVNLALRRLLKKFGSEATTLPVSLDLYTELQQVAPDSLQYLLHDLFAANTFWDLEGGTATASRAGKGDWEVHFKPLVRKTTVDENGVVTEVPLNDYIELAVYANSPEGELGELLYSKKHQITTEEPVIKITVSKKPDLAGVDPNHLLIDRNMYNNFAPIEAK